MAESCILPGQIAGRRQNGLHMKDLCQKSSVATHLGHGCAPLAARVVAVSSGPAGLVARLASTLAIISLAASLAACRGPLSTLDTAGGDAAEIARLFWW